MSAHIRSKEWYGVNISCNKFQKGLPDYYFTKTNNRPRWVEYKIINKHGKISFTPAQVDKFPKLMANGTMIYVLCTRFDTPLEKNLIERKRLYEIFMGNPNGHWMTLGEQYYENLYY